MMEQIKILILIFIMFSFFSCSNEQLNKDVHNKSDSLKTEERKPYNFESIHQKEWKEHRKDTLQNNNKNSDTTIIKYRNPLK